MRTTTLITSSAPGLSGVGGVLISDMLNVDGVGKVSLAAIVPSGQAEQCDRSRILEFQSLEPKAEWFPEPRMGFFSTLARLRHRVFSYDRHVATLVQNAREFLSKTAPEQLWVILNSTSAIDMTHALLPDLNCELIVQVWDDPLHLCIQRKVDRLTRHRTMSRFTRILQRADRLGVICEEAQSHYGALTSTPSIIVRHGSSNENAIPNSEFETNEFRIGFSGSMYATSAWRTLEKALDYLKWRAGNRAITVLSVGKSIEFTSTTAASARFFGWRSHAETSTIMAGCDCLYLPQVFNENDRTFASFSFPTKLSMYVSTGRPILIHAPKHGSLHRFAREHEFGVLCDELDPVRLASLISRLAQEPMFRSHQAEATVRVSREILTHKAFSAGVRMMLGVDPIQPTRLAR